MNVTMRTQWVHGSFSTMRIRREYKSAENMKNRWKREKRNKRKRELNHVHQIYYFYSISLSSSFFLSFFFFLNAPGWFHLYYSSFSKTHTSIQDFFSQETKFPLFLHTILMYVGTYKSFYTCTYTYIHTYGYKWMHTHGSKDHGQLLLYLDIMLTYLFQKN